jgi:multicomponent Na+:H+ antiporter subunit C
MSIYAYLVAGWLMLVGLAGIVRSRDLVHVVVSLSIAQAGTYVLLLGIGFERGATAPVFGSSTPTGKPVVDPVVQALALTDVVVSATVTALLLAIVMRISKRLGTVDPDELRALRG